MKKISKAKDQSDPLYEAGRLAGLDVHGPDYDGCVTSADEEIYEAGYTAGVRSRLFDPSFRSRLASRALFCGRSGFEPCLHACHSEAERRLVIARHRAGLIERMSWSESYRRGRDTALGQIVSHDMEFSKGFRAGLEEQGRVRAEVNQQPAA